MESIIKWLGSAIVRSMPELDLSPIGDKSHGKLKLSPEQLLTVIHGQALAIWALTYRRRLTRLRMKRGPGGPCPIYADGGGTDGLVQIV